jgi:hypothetical protein
MEFRAPTASFGALFGCNLVEHSNVQARRAQLLNRHREYLERHQGRRTALRSLSVQNIIANPSNGTCGNTSDCQIPLGIRIRVTAFRRCVTKFVTAA